MNRRSFFFCTTGAAALVLAQSSASDDKIHDQVMMKLAADADVKGGGLTVEVSSGVVTVKGFVSSDKAKVKAEKLIKKVKGVTGVKNLLEVRLAGVQQ